MLSAGREEEALRYINTYRNITDSVFNVENERSFGILRHNYEKSKQEKIMKEKEQRYSRRIPTFYPNFQKETGVPPSRFRQEVLKMNGKSPEDISE